MNIVLYNNLSKRLVADKELTTLDTVTGNFVETVDSLRPRFRIKKSEASLACDYVEIPDLHRFYYVTGRNNVTNEVLELDLEVDTRKSFIAALREKSGVVCRQTNNYDMYLGDNSIPSSIKRNTSIYQYQSTPFTSDGYGINIMMVLGGR